MSIEIPPGARVNLVSGESVHRVLKTYSLLNKPEYTILTDRHILYFNEKILGRYDLSDIPYSRLLEMTAERGRLRFGSIEFTSEDKKEIKIKHVPKDDIQPFVEALEIAINNVAVEPISISRGKGLLGKRTWEFHKTPEMLFKSRPTRADTLERREFVKDAPEDDPLKKLKMRFVNGEITEEEYLRMKRILE
jgi:hypothetical protein